MWVNFRCKFLAEVGQFYARINSHEHDGRDSRGSRGLQQWAFWADGSEGPTRDGAVSAAIASEANPFLTPDVAAGKALWTSLRLRRVRDRATLRVERVASADIDVR